MGSLVEGMLFAALVVAILIPIFARFAGQRWMAIPSAAVVAVMALQLAKLSRSEPDRALVRSAPRELRAGRFTSSRTCRACHPGPYQSWHRSYHRTMTQIASPDAVQAPFAGEWLSGADGQVQLRRRGDRFYARFAGGPDRWQRVVMTTGSHHFQVYWVRHPSGAFLQVPFLYLLREKRWIPNEHSFLRPPGDLPTPLWNDNCIACHTTGALPRVDRKTGRMKSGAAELGIACESCHGPAAAHVAANHDPTRRYGLYGHSGGDPTIVNPARLDHRRATEACGQCHSISLRHRDEKFLEQGWSYEPGKDLSAFARPIRYEENPKEPWLQKILRENPTSYHGGFWRDGTVRVAGREYNGLLESACYQRGKMSCLSCHSMHRGSRDDQLGRGMRGDRACLQCHEKYRDRIREHTHHLADSSGSRCYNCHMPHTSFGVLTGIRSHRVDSPTQVLAARSGRPNACNLCHLDRPLGWTAQWLRRWYKAAPAPLDPDERTVAAGIVWLLRGDAVQRAITAWNMSWKPAQQASGVSWMPPYLAELLSDDYAAVRHVAARTLRSLRGYDDIAYDASAAAPARVSAAARVRRRWRKRTEKRERLPAPALLLDARGRRDTDAAGRLLQNRDRTPVAVDE